MSPRSCVFPVDNPAEQCAGVAHGDQRQRQGPFGHGIGGAVRRIHGTDVAGPQRFQVQARGKPVAFQFADETQPGSGVQDRGVDPRRAVADDEGIHAGRFLRQPRRSLGVRAGVVDSAAALAGEPCPIGERLEAGQFRRRQVSVAYPFAAGDEYSRSVVRHSRSLWCRYRPV